MKTVIRENKVESDEGRFCYRLRLADGGSRTRYDLTVSFEPRAGGSATSCLLCDIAYDYDTATEIFGVFVRETVSPCHAAEVFDLLSERSPELTLPRPAGR